jgi:calcineurin-like phosphoesterase family protein
MNTTEATGDSGGAGAGGGELTPAEKAQRTRQARIGRAQVLSKTWVDAARTVPKQRPPRTWYTADLHLGHERIIELCDRPFGGVAEMNEALLDGINTVVARQDTLVVAGDVLLGTFEESVKLLGQIRAGRIRLLPGNHDRWSLAYTHRGSPEVVKNKRRMWMADYQDAGRRRGLSSASSGIECVPDRRPSVWPMTMSGRPVLLSHYPYLGSGDSRPDRPDRYEWLRPVDAGLPLIHGHVHGRWRTNGRMFNVGVDVNGFAPVSEDLLRDWLGSLGPGAGVIGQNAANRDR